MLRKLWKPIKRSQHAKAIIIDCTPTFWRAFYVGWSQNCTKPYHQYPTCNRLVKLLHLKCDPFRMKDITATLSISNSPNKRKTRLEHKRYST